MLRKVTKTLVFMAPAAFILVSETRAQVAGTKQAPTLPFGGAAWYASLELRHHVNTYYDEQGYYARQQPSFHARTQMGAQFYAGMLDVYATLGVYKLTDTQQILQRQPEVAIDFYPFKNDYVSLLQYNLVQLPYDGMQPDPDADEEPMAFGTVYTIGLAPSVRWPLASGLTRYELKAGLDGWTRLYSQRQFTNDYRRKSLADDEDEDRDHLGLDDMEANAEPIEDTAMHYRTVAMVGGAIAPGFAPDLSTEVTVNYKTRYEPHYTRQDDGTVDYYYKAERASFYRLRLAYALNERVTIMNDFHHFYDGFFANKRMGDTRRFRNIARITCKL